MLKQFTGALSQKEKSLKELYSLIVEQGPVSKSDLIKCTGMRQTTCSRLIDELLEMGLIVESGYGESSGGRKPVVYEIKEDANYVIGIDISRTYTKVLLMNLRFVVIDEAKLVMNETTTPTFTIDFISSSVHRMAEKFHLTQDNILGAGIGTIGPLDRENGIIVNPINFLSDGWMNLQITHLLAQKLQLNTLLDYGTNTALLAEYQQEPFKKYKNIVHVLKGAGTRTGMIMDGRLVRGTDKLGMLGQGHMVVDLHGRKCICGSNGCVHAYSSISAMKRDILNGIEQGAPSIIRDLKKDPNEIDFNDICQALNERDSLVTRVIKDAAYYTGVGLANLAHVLFPDVIILSGPTYTNMDLFYDVVTETAAGRCQNMYPDQEIIFTRGQLGENASAIGAGRMVLDHYLTDHTLI
ncbi:ROK family protein [Bacillus sp. B190/17]|uniref:ROK family protein n=1 Tax=Bacillus lumedeiriae TaxID=3058829 RepID=A0ABW8ICM9_9BACI